MHLFNRLKRDFDRHSPTDAVINFIQLDADGVDNIAALLFEGLANGFDRAYKRHIGKRIRAGFYSYASTSRMVRRAALRAGKMDASADRTNTSPSQIP